MGSEMCIRDSIQIVGSDISSFNASHASTGAFPRFQYIRLYGLYGLHGLSRLPPLAMLCPMTSKVPPGATSLPPRSKHLALTNDGLEHSASANFTETRSVAIVFRCVLWHRPRAVVLWLQVAEVLLRCTSKMYARDRSSLIEPYTASIGCIR